MAITLELAMEPVLQQALRRLAALQESNALDDALVAAAQPVANTARANAPVITGTLRRSIRVEIIAPGDVRIGSDLAYARRIEFGFMGRDSLGREYHQAAQSYLRAAFDQHREGLRAAIAAAAMQIVRSAAGVR
jgi:HK97 gp10 family phage protein